MKPYTTRWHDGLLLAQGLALVLLLLSHARTVGDSQSMLFHDHVLDSVFSGPIWGSKLGYNLVFFTLAMVFVHALFGVLCWGLARLSRYAWPSLQATPRQQLFLWFVILTIGLLAHNAAIFSTSSLGEPYAEVMIQSFLGLRLGQWLWFGALVAAASAVLSGALRWWKAGGRLSRKWSSILLISGASIAGLAAFSRFETPRPAVANQPDVILIGLDSLRADLADERLSPHVTPNVEAFMKGGTRFTNALTPLARTFPSMMAMLTGRHPHHSGAIMNLLPRSAIDDSESLPRTLAHAGYETVFAMDEMRFANIDTTYGFGQTITPPIGASEFLIEKLIDTPLSNLLINTRLGSWLFPHAYANRGIAKTYDPDSFVERIDRELRPSRPLFLTVHLTLDHWPYSWAGAPIKQSGDKDARWPPYYLAAANRVDRQMGDILEVLRKKGLLENAIVVVFSDHGETFNAPNQALATDDNPVMKELSLSRPAWGHGTSVLALDQYRILLGVRRYGSAASMPPTLSAPVSFEDIAPTIQDMLGAKSAARYDGRSLLPLIEGTAGAAQAFTGRIRFMETEYQMPVGMATQEGEINSEKMREAMRVYSIDPDTDRVTVKQGLLKDLLVERHYAALGGQYLVGAVPNYDGAGYNYLAARLSDGALRRLSEQPAADQQELRALWDALHAQFDDVLLSRPGVAVRPVANRERTIPSSVTK
jgi:arylsulfatase A-like enzyme